MLVESVKEAGGSNPKIVDTPAPTAWPIILALGLALLAGGMISSAAVSVLGAILAVAGCVGWFREVLPHEANEQVPIEEPAPTVEPSLRKVARAKIAEDLKRAWLPLEFHPVSAGVRGGLAGSVAMAALAMLYGIVSGNGIWYPVNLLAAGFLPPSRSESVAGIAVFQPSILLIATTIHLLTSLLVGLLYGAMLPMFPRRPILLGGFIAPLMWSGLIHGILGIVNPILNQRIDWVWFVVSQMAFGVVAGVVVSRSEKTRTAQPMPLALIFETPATIQGERREDEKR